VKLNAREKYIIIGGVALVVAIGIFYAATTLLPNGGELSTTVEARKKMISRQLETLGRKEAYQQRIEQYKKRLDQDMAQLLPGDKSNEASAEMQARLKEFADKSGVEIIQKNTLADKKVQDVLTKVSVHIEANCDPERLVYFLTYIESYPKLLKVEEFNVYSYRGVQRRSEIRASLTVVGYIGSKPGEKPANNAVAAAR
jgi:hypothetical protein